jgi:nicotinate-nucleotide adenylyltransferase
MKVGLFGGTFDPPHEGHAHVAQTALRRLGLDRVVWLVSPQNPLKIAVPDSALAARLAMTGRIAAHPSMMVSDAESRLGSRFTIDTIRRLKARFTRVHFVWIMGADALAGFHRWRAWRQIMKEAPVAVISRPKDGLRGLNSPAARIFARSRLPATMGSRLALAKPPAWIYLVEPLNFSSSRALREGRRPADAKVL